MWFALAARGIWNFLTSKMGVVFLCVVVLCLIEWKVYGYGQDSVRADAQQQIQKAQNDAKTKVDSIQAKYDKLLGDTNKWKADNAAAQETAKKVNDAVVVALHDKLIATTKQVSQLKVQLKELNKYVTAKADSQCVIPTGFVSVYNAAVKAGPLPDSGAGNVDAPSGITLSRLAEIDAANLSECYERGEVIKAWQTWYSTNKAAYDAATEKAK